MYGLIFESVQHTILVSTENLPSNCLHYEGDDITSGIKIKDTCTYFGLFFFLNIGLLRIIDSTGCELRAIMVFLYFIIALYCFHL